MSELIEKPNTAAAILERNVFEKLEAAVATTPFEGDLLRFTKGEYLAPNDELIEAGTEVVAHLPALQIGWLRWEHGKPVRHEMGYVAENYRPARRAELGDNDSSTWPIDDQGQPRDPWQETMYLPITEFLTRRRYFFTTSSKGGMRALASLAGAFGRRLRDKPQELPIVSLNVGSYRHPNRGYGKIFVPEFPIIGWVDAAVLRESEHDGGENGPTSNGRSIASTASTLF